MKRRAEFWEKEKGKRVLCTLCPRECVISEGKYGYCGARKNIEGELYSVAYAETTAANSDPIEKKPLYHFHPGTRVFSMSTAGCNFECKHCQNWRLSQSTTEEVHTERITPEEAIERTEKTGCDGIAYTYGEPVIWFEYALDTSKLASEKGLYNVFVTNGYINTEAWGEIQPYLDGMNVDVKAFNDEFYRDICGVPSVRPVLKTCEWAVENEVHLEITNLLIPNQNDDPDQIRKMCRWISKDLNPSVPLHFSRFTPQYKFQDKTPTPVKTLEKAYDIAKEEGIEYVYVGNVPGHKGNSTFCPECGELVISRRGFSVAENKLENGKCPNCKRDINVITK